MKRCMIEAFVVSSAVSDVSVNVRIVYVRKITDSVWSDFVVQRLSLQTLFLKNFSLNTFLE